ncbi:hypothetical protein H5410_054474 [Solanum commersonii]|uniref:Auxin-induced SAUR n=1 Tax=Solanum commersonii TaxID=4109 RepID=A0A9J5WGH9_SOLCO|nr:hypothetical protein H5410_054474 [Solanum commersonii]
MAMISTKKLIKMARKWQKFAAMQRKRISFPRNVSDADSCNTSSSSTVEKGHFVVYTPDQARFVIPLVYLENEIIRQLLNMSEEEFGLPSGGPITLPCDSAFMDYIIFANKERRNCRRSSQSIAPLNSFLLLFNFFFANQESGNQQLLVC